ncbi:DNA processing protein DprA [Cupriavidus sp. HPC(L)]|uniref:DNA-processing protein DprA n=1 Tax=Cupriavidus sp. HPC(L) TaxID=1217418 RepID=UPI0002911E1B|nr:DNA-processing protein DprA [Cupriavidus sp. HPC(L)]ESJ25399.1 DNA processing protein DprA [Cupriavidus sp. HPC(L)]
MPEPCSATDGRPAAIDPGEVAAWLRLEAVPGLGRRTARLLLDKFGLPQQVLSAGEAQLARWLPLPVARAVRAQPDPALSARIERTLAWLREPGHHLLTLADPGYPRALLDLGDPPLMLYAHGRLESLRGPALAVVGARSATVQGERDAQMFASAFSAAGIAVVSGLALGIDAAAHAGGLGGPGGTIAVVGTGLDRCYPASHRALAQRIAAEGLLLSELPLGTPARSQHFPQRNRLIAALARGVLVVEAALRSGSLITARLAADLGREVFAVPGSIHAPLAAGCHRLIQQGAKLVECPQDVFDELGLVKGSGAVARPGAMACGTMGELPCGRTDALGTALAYDPVDPDTLCARTGLPPEAVTAALLELEFAGAVERMPGNLYRRLT